ncbi:MAG: hypothetical protein H5U26_00660 [Immundisolibacter sp.]|uniref:hypothetical protein n=1 Tax=Immundisolibacter sp. TaxID=1934948 RepID=UPI00199DB902|nr:hypothetical protein [Immundisolibacter sp.]MBC7160606.1 hypothetical protein [Immundisolibacter sp.]
MADARRNQLTDAYAAVREAARERRTATLKQNATVQEFVPERDDELEDGAGQPQARFPSPAYEREPKQPAPRATIPKPAPQTRDTRAKAAGQAPALTTSTTVACPTCPT